MSRVLAQARFDLGTWLRNGEQAVLNVLLPLLALAGSSHIQMTGETRAVAITVFAISTSSFAGIAIATAFDRRAGALRIFGISPLGRRGFVQARLLTAVTISAVQVAALHVLAVVAHIDFSMPLQMLWVAPLLATAWLSSALFLASVLRAEAVLALANLLFIASMASVWLTLESRSWISFTNPSAAAFHAGLGDMQSLAAVGIWALLTTIAAISSFRWE